MFVDGLYLYEFQLKKLLLLLLQQQRSKRQNQKHPEETRTIIKTGMHTYSIILGSHLMVKSF